MDDQYNVYNTFDSNFINYGELYKSPKDMKMNSKDLIGDYADALVKGPSDVYINSPDLVGNRYFINTNTLCINKDDNSKTENRSVLVDNVMTSAMGQAKGGNSGLLYSLLGSLKTLDTDSMFLHMKDNEPTSHINTSSIDSTDYLKDVYKRPMPLCSEVTVYSSDEKNDVVSGWVTDEDRQNIDPAALLVKESFVQMGDIVTPGLTPEKFAEQANKLNDATQAQADAIKQDNNSKASSALDKANSEISAHNKKGQSFSMSAASDNMSRVKKNRATGKQRGEAARRSGQSQMLKQQTAKYLSTEKPSGAVGYSTFELLTNLINTTYHCGDNEEQLVRVPAACIKEIFSKNIPPNEPSIDKGRSNLCPGQTFDEISVQNFVNELIKSVKDNQDNTNELGLPGLPPKQICIRVESKPSGFNSFFGAKPTWSNKYIDSDDYKKYEDSIESYRPHIAREIVRYKSVGVFGQCNAVSNSEGFTTQLLSTPTNNINLSFGDLMSYFFMIVMIFVLFFILYKFVLRFFHIEKALKWKSLKMKK